MELRNDNHALYDYMASRKKVYDVLMPVQCRHAIVSEANYIVRGHCACGDEIGIRVHAGDICYIDFGQDYLNECGFQHFGLVLRIIAHKALVVPMTSNPHTCALAYDAADNPQGRTNLFFLGRPSRLRKPSVLFLNDVRFINTARVIDVTGHISTESALFHRVSDRLKKMLFGKQEEADCCAKIVS